MKCRGEAVVGFAPGPIVLMSLRPAIPRRVGLHQSPPPLCRSFSYWTRPARRASPRCDRVLIRTEPEARGAQERIASPPGHELSGSNDLPWALTRVLHAIPKIKRHSGAGDQLDVRAPAVVCSKDVKNVFIPGERASTIAVNDAGWRRGNGRAGKLSKSTEPRQQGKEDGMDKAAVTANASEAAGNHRGKMPLASPRG